MALMVMCWLAYSLATFARLTYNVSIVDVVGHFGLTNADAGLVATCFSLCYGIGQLINGAVAGRIAPRKMIFFGLVGSAVMNALIPFVPFGAYKFIWAANGLIQSVLWCNIMQIFADMLGAKDIGRAVVVIGTTTATGTLLAYAASAVCVSVSVWQTIFHVATVLLVGCAIAWFVITKRLTVAQRSCPVVITHRAEDAEHHKISWVKLLSYSVPILFLACFACNFTKSLYNDWAVPVLDYAFPWLGGAVAKTITIVVPLIAILGSFVARGLFARFKNPFVSYVLLYFAIAVLACVMSVVFKENVVVTVGIFVLIALAVTTVNVTCTSILPLNMRSYGRAGGIAGIINCCCHLGETAGSVLLGHVSDVSGWSSVFIVAAVVGVCVSAICIIGARHWRKNIQGGGKIE